MLSFLKKIFGSTPTVAKVPYKVEAPKVQEVPVKTEKKTADKKPAVKAKTARKPKVPKPD
jgi:hypothetical protein